VERSGGEGERQIRRSISSVGVLIGVAKGEYASLGESSIRKKSRGTSSTIVEVVEP